MSTSIIYNGYTVVQDEGSNLPVRSVLDFQGAGVTAADVGGKTVVSIPGGGAVAPIYGSFYDTTTQTVTAGQVKGIELNTTDISGGVFIANDALGNPTRIVVNTTGVYDIQFSAQLNRTSGGSSADTHIWLRKNELDVPWSDTGITMQSNTGKMVASWNFFVSLNANEYVELMWTQNDAIEILASGAGPNYPETPSVIVTVNKIN